MNIEDIKIGDLVSRTDEHFGWVVEKKNPETQLITCASVKQIGGKLERVVEEFRPEKLKPFEEK